MVGNKITKVLVLGGYGLTGRCLTPLLLKETDLTVVVAGRDLEKAQAMASELNGEFEGDRVEAARVDASDSESLRIAFEKVDMVIVVAATAQYVKVVASAALDAGIDYLDVQISKKHCLELQAMSQEIKASGCCFITEAGFHPGLPSLLCRYANQEFDILTSAITSSVIRGEISPDLPMPVSVYELVENLTSFEGIFFKDGKWRKPHLWWLWPYRRFFFGKDFGHRLCVPIMFEELRMIPSMIPSIRETGFFIAGINWFVDWVVTPLAMVSLLVFPKKAVKPIAKLLFWGMKTFSRSPFGTMFKLDANGQKDGCEKHMEVFLFHEEEYMLTAIPVVAVLRQFLGGAVRKPGLWMMGHVANPSQTLEDMKRLGIHISTVTR